MMTSKFIGHFLEEISGWQKTLCTVDTVITLWMDVQRTWSPIKDEPSSIHLSHVSMYQSLLVQVSLGVHIHRIRGHKEAASR